jgi:hypothetical protein
LLDLKNARLDDNSSENKLKIKENSVLRAVDVAENETYFTNKLRCIGNSKDLQQLALKVSVGPIYDKTSKVFPFGSTAISDMVINSLSYVKAISVVETPLSGDITESRTNILSANYNKLAKIYKDNIVAIGNKTGHIPFGVLFPSTLHITGALVQYDEGSDTLSPTIKLDVDAFSFRRSVDVITVGLHLRLINSTDGEVLSNSTKGKRGSVLLSNKFYKLSLDNSLFRIINAKQYGLDYSVTVADPKHYVIQEIVEKGIAELLSVLPNENNCSEQYEVKYGQN